MHYCFLSRIFPFTRPVLDKLDPMWRDVYEVVLPAQLVVLVSMGLFIGPGLDAVNYIESLGWRTRSANYYGYVVSELEKSASPRGWSDKGRRKRGREDYPYWTVHPQA